MEWKSASNFIDTIIDNIIDKEIIASGFGNVNFKSQPVHRSWVAVSDCAAGISALRVEVSNIRRR
jgi:hypothetical protein